MSCICAIVEHATQNTAVRVPAIVEKDKGSSRTDGPTRREQAKQSIMEKQVCSLFNDHYCSSVIKKL